MNIYGRKLLVSCYRCAFLFYEGILQLELDVDVDFQFEFDVDVDFATQA